MRFMMFVASDSQPDADPEAPGEIEAWVDDVESRGKRITVTGCAPPAVRRRFAFAAAAR